MSVTGGATGVSSPATDPMWGVQDDMGLGASLFRDMPRLSFGPRSELGARGRGRGWTPFVAGLRDDRPRVDQHANSCADAGQVRETAGVHVLGTEPPGATGVASVGSHQWPKVKVEPYTGSPLLPGPKVFLRDCERLIVSVGCSEQDFLRRWIPTLLVEEAWDWFMDNRDITTWREFKLLMMEFFQPHNSDDRIHELILGRQQKEGESVVEYADAMLKLFARLLVPLSEGEKIRLMYRNMADHIQLMLCTKEFTRVRQLIYDAERVEGKSKALLTPKPSSSGGFVKKAQEPKKGDFRMEGVGSGKRKACYICGDPNHFARACPRRVRDQPSENESRGSSSDTSGAPRP